MNTALKHFWLLMVVVLSLVLVGVVSAQDAPAAATEVVVVSNASDTQATGYVRLNTGELVINVTSIIVGLVTAFIGGTVGGIAGLGAFINRVKRDDILKLAIERLYLSTPPAVQDAGRELVGTVRTAVDLIDEVTDGVLPTSTTTPTV